MSVCDEILHMLEIFVEATRKTPAIITLLNHSP